jgi:hypothetical protein
MKTQKRHSIKKPYTVFQTGNIIICTRIPMIKRNSKHMMVGGKESENEYLQTQIFQNLISQLATSPTPDQQQLKQYLENLKLKSDKDALLTFVFSQKSDLKYETLFDAIIRRKLNVREIDTPDSAANQLFTILSTKVKANDQIQKIKNEVESSSDIDKNTKLAILKSLENGSNVTISSVSTGAMNTLKKGSLLLANFFAPTPDSTQKKKKWNENNVEILFYDQDHLHYRKGDSMPMEQSDTNRFGDIMILNHPTKYTDTKEYFSSMYTSVEDLLAHIASAGENLLCLGNSEKCKKYSVKPRPYTRRVMRIVNKQPQNDVDNMKS